MSFGRLGAIGRGFGHLGGLGKALSAFFRADTTKITADTTALTADYAR